MLISHAEIEELTDYKVYKKQRLWLLNNGIKFTVGASGRPKVLRTEIDRIMFGGVESKINQPNFSAING